MARVFVLGAGSSIAVMNKAPRNDELLPRILKLRREPRISPLKQFLEDFYQIVPDSQGEYSRKVPLEDVLSQLDFCIAENRPLSTTYSLATLAELRETLVYGICRVLKQSLRSGELYLMKKLIRKLSPNDVIISLNYDLIVDNSVMHASKTPDYGIPIRQVRNPHVLYYNLLPESVQVYKLHGSLNWLYCPVCRAVDLTPGEKAVLYIFENKEVSNCPICGTRYDPVIITPTFLKNYDNRFIGQVWLEAETRLQSAHEIIFIGYSLPDADIILRTMFARSIYWNRLLNGQSPHITVIDSNTAQNPTRERYEALFGNIDYMHQGFKYYVQNILNN